MVGKIGIRASISDFLEKSDFSIGKEIRYIFWKNLIS